MNYEQHRDDFERAYVASEFENGYGEVAALDAMRKLRAGDSYQGHNHYPAIAWQAYRWALADVAKQAAPVAQLSERNKLLAARYRFAFVESPEWTYAVCKWDGCDWLPINTSEDEAELDAAMLAAAPTTPKDAS